MSEPERTQDEPDAWVAETVPGALAYALTLVRNRTDAEDLVHDCYVRLLARRNEYNLPRDGSKLLYRAVTNACFNWLKRRPPVVSLGAAEQASGENLADVSDAEPQRRAIYNELEHAVKETLLELPTTQRAAIELRSLGHSLLEVAEMLNISHTNARVQLHRARQVLATRLKPFFEDHVR